MLQFRWFTILTELTIHNPFKLNLLELQNSPFIFQFHSMAPLCK